MRKMMHYIKVDPEGNKEVGSKELRQVLAPGLFSFDGDYATVDEYNIKSRFRVVISDTKEKCEEIFNKGLRAEIDMLVSVEANKER